MVVAAHVPGGDVSGCGIDKSVHALEDVGATLGVAWLTGLSVAWRDESGAITLSPRPVFRRLVGEGVVTGSTRVLDLSPTTLAEARTRGIERRAGESWHGTVFRIPEATPTA